MKNKRQTKKIAEAAVMIALATVLSICEIFKLPYGGSVTAASMLPILIFSYRHGIGMGLSAAATYATVQQLLGLNNLFYVTGWQSVLAVIFLDYLLAFTVIGLGGIFRGRIISHRGRVNAQAVELALGMIFVCILRYAFHTIAGATVWAGLSIPTEAALIYSLGYNAIYMIPESVVSFLASAWVGGVIDLSRDVPIRVRRDKSENPYRSRALLLRRLSALAAVITVGAVFLLFFTHINMTDEGKLSFDALIGMNFSHILHVFCIGAVLAVGLLIAARVLDKKR